MAVPDGDNLESSTEVGGVIPGNEDAPAYAITLPQPSPVPILIAVPHAGRSYAGPLLGAMRNPAYAQLKLEDRYADLIGTAVARATGASLLIAQAPRAMIDLNRAADDIDWGMIDRHGRPAEVSSAPGMRARSGLGLIPRRIPGLGELWNRPHDESEVVARIAGIHGPYHAALATALQGLRNRWGAALLIDLHSMPPLGARGDQPAAEFVLGDRFGASCDGQLIASAFTYLASQRRLAAHNRPYAGGYVLERHARPERCLHALQLEIDRTSYLDSRLAEPGPGFADMVQILTGLVRHMAGEVAALGAAHNRAVWAEAAE